MKVEITAETERIVNEQLSKGYFESLDELIVSGVQAWHERNPRQASTGGEQIQNPNGGTKAREFVQWAAGHRDTPPLSDEAISRANLYPDRG